MLTTDKDTLGIVWSEVDHERFHEPRHSRLWDAIGICWVEHGSVDMALLKSALRPGEDADAMLSLAAKCAESVPTWRTWNSYAKIVNEKWRLRRLMRACQSAAWQLSKAGDGDDTITRVMDEIGKAGRAEARDDSIQLAAAERGLMDMLERREAQCVPTGLDLFDREFVGLPKTGLVSIFGYPASGKTTLTLNVSEQLAARGLPVRVFSYEQNATRIAATMLSLSTGLSVHSWINQGRQPDEIESAALTKAIQQHATMDFGVVDRSLDAPGIFRECQAVGLKGRPGVAVVDYIQNLPGWGVFQELTPRITESMRWMQRIARDLGWLVISVSQLDKQASKENRRPSLADGLGSSAIEQYSDMIVSVYRPHQREVLDDSLEAMRWTHRQRRCEVSVLKNKYGPNGSIDLSFDMKKMKFRAPNQDERGSWE